MDILVVSGYRYGTGTSVFPNCKSADGRRILSLDVFEVDCGGSKHNDTGIVETAISLISVF